MIQAMYYINCDFCHEYYPDAQGASNAEDALAWAMQRGWAELQNKHLCHRCVMKLQLPAKPKRTTKRKAK